jgi:hypothetical protein
MQKRGSIEAEDIDQVWHMDVTQVKSKEGIDSLSASSD